MQLPNFVNIQWLCFSNPCNSFCNHMTHHKTSQLKKLVNILSDKPNQEHSLKVFKIICKALIFLPKSDNRLKFVSDISGKPVSWSGFSIQNTIVHLFYKCLQSTHQMPGVVVSKDSASSKRMTHNGNTNKFYHSLTQYHPVLSFTCNDTLKSHLHLLNSISSCVKLDILKITQKFECRSPPGKLYHLQTTKYTPRLPKSQLQEKARTSLRVPQAESSLLLHTLLYFLFFIICNL